MRAPSNFFTGHRSRLLIENCDSFVEHILLKSRAENEISDINETPVLRLSGADCGIEDFDMRDLNRGPSVATYRDESVEAKWSDIRQVETLSN